nr:MAG TPA: hypothetical protein [Caudoviricetes sp.]
MQAFFTQNYKKFIQKNKKAHYQQAENGAVGKFHKNQQFTGV